MKVIVLLFVCAVTAFGYGYWDSFGDGGRVQSIAPVSAGMCGATVPDSLSALSLFINSSALASAEKITFSLSGWELGWREEITYHYTCVEPFRYNIGAMTPSGACAVTVPLGRGLTAGAGIATVAQYQMQSTAQEYTEITSTQRELWRTFYTDPHGSLTEALVSMAGTVGPVSLGFSPGVRFGTGGATTYVNRVNGADSVLVTSWEHSEFCVRAGANMKLDYTVLYSTFVSGDSRYSSFYNLGVSASFPFMKGGYLGTEIGFVNGNDLNVTAFTRLPGVVEGSNMYLGLNGYRPDFALKTGIGLSIGGDYSFGNYRVSGAYFFHSRYREGTAVPLPYINHLYDAGDLIILGVERIF